MDSDDYDDDDDLVEKELEIKLDITKKSRRINRPVQFADQHGHIMEEVRSDSDLQSQYIARNPVSRVIQCAAVQSENEINTIRADFISQGMNHAEGGWPKDINPVENDQTMRFRKKIEKDENYVNTALKLCSTMESCIKQNNAIEIYQDYFNEIDEATDCEEPRAKTVNLYRDPESADGHLRPVSSIAWNPDGEQIAIAYCNLEFLGLQPETPKTSYIFNIEDPTKPLLDLYPPYHLVSCEFNPKDGHLLAGGCYNGQVCWWDDRKGGKPEGEINLSVSHIEPVYKTMWIQSKTLSEFFTASTDGTVMWWDIRKFTTPVEKLVLDPRLKEEDGSTENAQGATCLEYEPTIPTKFMVGTEQGNVFACNRKAKSPAERIVGIYQAHFGPVYALQRNPCFPKNFLTVGDWCARIWSEDIKESAIMWTSSYTENLTDGCWSPTRPSVFFTARQDGVLDAWDILYQQKAPILSIKVCDDAVNCIKVHDQGCLMAVGCNNGNTSLLELSDSLSVSNKNEKSAVTAMFERETRREKILEARNKELRLKEKTKGILGLGGMGGGKKAGGLAGAFDLLKKNKDDDEVKEDPIAKAEREFFEIIKKEQEKRIAAKKEPLEKSSELED